MNSTSRVALAGVGLGFASLAHALVPAQDFASRARRADLIVLVEPTSAECRYTVDQDWALETQVWLAPLASWKGTAPADLSLVLPGGTLGTLGVTVEDVPSLPVDQPVVLLLVETPGGWIVLDGELGAIPVRYQEHGEGRPAEQVQRALQAVLP